MSKCWGNSYGKNGIPDKKTDNGMPGDDTLFPGDARMSEVSYDSSDGGSNEIRKPKEIIIIDNEIGNDGVERIIKEGNTNANESIFAGADGGGRI